jgi:hypothetical protein
VFLGNRLVTLWCVVLLLAVNTAGAQSLGSPAAVLDALKQSRGDVVLAFIDSPADQSSALRNIQGLLSVYDVTLNGEDLGSVRRNSVLHVRPRLGLNRLVIRDAFDSSQSAEMSFPAMRSAGVSTSIVEIRTSRQFNWIEALLLSGREVQAIEDALTRDKSGGMARVLRLIRSRGHEPVKAATKRANWSRGVVSYGGDSNDDSGSDSDGSTSTASSSDAASSESTAPASTDSSATATEAAEATDATAADSETSEDESSYSVSADRRSYY